MSKEGDALMEFQRAQKGRAPKRRYSFGIAKPLRVTAALNPFAMLAISAQSENVSMSNVSIVHVPTQEVR